MLVSKKKHDLLIKNYNELVDNRDKWQGRCIHHANNLDRAYEEINELREMIREIKIDKNRDINNLKLERDTYKEKYKEWFQNFIKTKSELEKVDKIVLQYEQRINELEEKEMTKYAKITKYLGPHNIDKRLGLEIGKTYKIVEYKSPLTDNCYIYLNDEYPYYFISERQYELVEKEETPTFKTTIGLKSSVQAKIDSLTTEAEHLFKKRDRLEQQAINLSKKARKLNNLIESIKEFE